MLRAVVWALPTLFLASCLKDPGPVLRIAYDLSYGGAESMDPYDPNAFWPTINLVFDRLISADEAGEPQPRLATSWQPSDDGLSWTVTLRDDVRFHDGSSFDARDVVYSFERILDPEFDSPLLVTLGDIERVLAVDRTTVRFELARPDYDLPFLLLDYRVLMTPEGSLDTIRTAPVGTGPFQVAELDPEGTTRLLANPDYFAGAPSIERVDVVAIPDTTARVQALLGGQIDLLDSVDPLMAQVFERATDFTVDHVVSGNWNGLSMRTDRPPFDDARVRRALRLPVDRQELTRMVLGPSGGEPTCDNPVWRGDPYRYDRECERDVDEAKRLLEAAGYPDGIDVELFTSDVEDNFLVLAEVYQEQVKAAGIRVAIRQTSSDGYWNDVGLKEAFFVTSWGQRPSAQILNEGFRSDARSNETHWQNTRFDALIAAARSERDEEQRKRFYQQAQQLMFEEGSTMIPYHLNLARVYNKRVSGVDRVISDYLRWERIRLDG